MGFKINKKVYDTQNGGSSRMYVSKPGEYRVRVDAAKVVTRRAGGKLGIVEATILEGPEDGHKKGTEINWASATEGPYGYQERDLKNFTQAALKKQAKDQDLELEKDYLEDPERVNDVFIDAEDHEDDEAPDTPVKSMELLVKYSVVINKRTNQPVMVKDKEGNPVEMLRGVWQ